MRNSKKYISASDVGQANYCPYKLYLQKTNGVGKQTSKRFQQGVQAHNRYNQGFRSGSLIRFILVACMVAVLVLLWR